MPVDASQTSQSTYLLYPIGHAPPLARTNTTHAHTLASDSQTSEPPLEVRWGHAPGLETAGEATCTQKIARLEQFIQDYGPLNEQTGVKVIDLRPGSGISIVGKKNSFKPASLR